MACVEDRRVSGRTGRRTSRHGQGRRWRAVWAGPGGQRHSRSLSSRPDAARWAAEMAAGAAFQQQLVGIGVASTTWRRSGG